MKQKYQMEDKKTPEKYYNNKKANKAKNSNKSSSIHKFEI